MITCKIGLLFVVCFKKLKMKNLLTIAVLGLMAFTTPENDPCMSGITYYSFEEALAESSKAKVLDVAMQHPKLTTLPVSIGKLTNLECIDASFNRISTLPDEMKNLKNLKKLNLSGNQYLSKFPEILKEISSLEEVDFTGIPQWSKEKCDAAKAALPGVKVLTDK